MSFPIRARISLVAQTVYPLRQLLLRALHTTPVSQGGGKRTSQPTRSRTSSSGSGVSRHRPPSSSTSGASSRLGSPVNSPSPSRWADNGGGKPKPVDDRVGRSGPGNFDNRHRLPPTTSRRLAELPRASRPGFSSRGSILGGDNINNDYSRERLGYGPRDVNRDKPPHLHTRYPTSKPFTAPSYPTPKTPLTSGSSSSSTSTTSSSALSKPFTQFKLNEGLLQSLSNKFGKSGRTSPIQALSLDHFVRGDNGQSVSSGARVLLGAETGSGKTLAYLLPLFHHLKLTDNHHPDPKPSPNSILHSNGPTNAEDHLNPRSIVISPTHELTRQSTLAAKSLSHLTKLSVVGLSSTQNGGIDGRSGNVDVLLGTGGSLKRVLGLSSEEDGGNREGIVSVKNIEWLIIDETDVLLGPDFIAETLPILQHILSNSTKPVNLILVSATLPPSLMHALTTLPPLSSSPFTKLLSPAIHKLPKSLDARFVPYSGSGNRLSDVVHEIKRVFAEDAIKRQQQQSSMVNARDYGVYDHNQSQTKSKVVVFCNTPYKVRHLSQIFEEKSLPNLAWTGEGDQRIRGSNGALNDFLAPNESKHSTSAPTTTGSSTTSTSTRILITTSLLSRGLDFSPSVSTVMLVDPPRDILDFVHRAGRAGRAGRPGRVIVFGMGNGSGSVIGGGTGSVTSTGGFGRDRFKEGTGNATTLRSVVGRRRSGVSVGENVRPGGRIRVRL